MAGSSRTWPSPESASQSRRRVRFCNSVPDTTHYIQNQRPDAVVDAIRDAIARI